MDKRDIIGASSAIIAAGGLTMIAEGIQIGASAQSFPLLGYSGLAAVTVGVVGLVGLFCTEEKAAKDDNSADA